MLAPCRAHWEDLSGDLDWECKGAAGSSRRVTHP
jgi:hypothetical protein